MSKYSILQWNQTIDSSNSLRPIFTFEPDTAFESYLQDNPGQPILLMIEGTDYYDGQQYGTCISSADFPTFGPNYARMTNQYVMVLHTEFTLYPRQPGTMSILDGVRAPALTPCAYRTMTTESYQHPSPLSTAVSGDEPPTPPSDASDKVCVNMGSYIVVGTIALVVLVIIFWWVYQRYVM